MADRLVAALTKIGVASRVDEDGRVLAFDGEKEYEITVDLQHEDTVRVDTWTTRRIELGTTAMAQIEDGGLTALFPDGLVTIAAAPTEPPGYKNLDWAPDEECPDCVDDEEGLTAQASDDDWVYQICPIRKDGGDIVGYRISGGDYQSGGHFGSALIGGEFGEFTVEKAKAAAEKSYLQRYDDAQDLLDLFLDNGEDDGLHIWRDDRGAILCLVGESDPEEVSLDVNLHDDKDSGGYGSATLSLRTMTGCGGSRRNLIEEVRRIIEHYR